MTFVHITRTSGVTQPLPCSFCTSQFDELNKVVTSSTETLQTSRSEINELKRTFQALQIELQSQLSLVRKQKPPQPP